MISGAKKSADYQLLGTSGIDYVLPVPFPLPSAFSSIEGFLSAMALTGETTLSPFPWHRVGAFASEAIAWGCPSGKVCEEHLCGQQPRALTPGEEKVTAFYHVQEKQCSGMHCTTHLFLH